MLLPLSSSRGFALNVFLVFAYEANDWVMIKFKFYFFEIETDVWYPNELAPHCLTHSMGLARKFS